MIDYFAYGVRNYAAEPVAPYVRSRWEYQAVLRGAVCRWCGYTEQPQRPRKNSLWISPPNSLHGWSGIEGEPCVVFVLHTHKAPESLINHAGNEAIEVSLSLSELQRLEDLAERLSKYNQYPSALGRLAGQHAIMELTLFALEADPLPPTPLAPEAYADHKIAQAVAWYEEHLSSSPTVAEVARGVGLSESHLRRLFTRAAKRSPLEVFNDLRFDRADELIVGTDLKIAAVAQMTGYSGPEAFHRAYAKHRGHPPGQLRRPPGRSDE